MGDVVYMVREDVEFEELRYSLRSIAANLPHERVWLFGARPPWVTGVVHVPVPQGSIRHVNTGRITEAIGRHRGLSPGFVWFHDDMYVLQSLLEIPRWHRCSWDVWARHESPGGKTPVTERLAAAFGVTLSLSYELHVPMVVERDALREMVEAVTAYDPFALINTQKRSLYGNWVGYGGSRRPDVKWRRARHDIEPGQLFASSPDASMRARAWRTLRAMFPEPCRYERQLLSL